MSTSRRPSRRSAPPPSTDAPTIGEVFRSGWHFLIPIGFLIAALIYPEVFRLTPEKVAIVCTGMLMLFSLVFGYRGRRASIPEILKAVVDTGRVSLDIILIGAAAGIMVGIMSISGLAFGMTLQLVALSGDNIFLLLLLIAVLAFLLGIGLPTVSVYILTATLLAPALIKLGVTPMAAHMFVMYNGILSMITPPVAFAAYAAANIARTDGWTTGWIACLVGWSTFILPFLFVLTPEPADGRLGRPPSCSTWRACCSASISARRQWSATRWRRCTKPLRISYAVLSLAVVLPPEAFSGAIWVNAVGIALAIAVLGYDHSQRRGRQTDVGLMPRASRAREERHVQQGYRRRHGRCERHRRGHRPAPRRRRLHGSPSSI